MRKRKDLTGQIFERLTVIKYHADKKRWECLCQCGNTSFVTSSHLQSHHTKSCGCLNLQKIIERATGHHWGRKCSDGRGATARDVWRKKYSNGCSFETFMKLSQLPCFYCERPANQSNRRNRYENNNKISQEWKDNAWFEYNGLDRIDPSQDHNESNLVPCCICCNFAKNDMTETQFVEWVFKVYHHWAKDYLDKIRKNNE